MWLDLAKQFIVGGTATAAISYLALGKNAKIPVTTAGFLYGAPILIPYLSILTYNSHGGEATATFNKHVLLGAVSSFAVLLSWIFIKRLGFNFVVGFNFVYMVALYGWYFRGGESPSHSPTLRG